MRMDTFSLVRLQWVGGLTRKTSEQHGGNVRMVDPCLHVDGTRLMVDNHDIGRDVGNREHKLITRMPSSQVSPVSDVSIDVDVLFPTVAVKEYHGHIRSSCSANSQIVVKVVERPGDEGLVDNSASLNGLEGGDQVGEFGGA
jgi:hypothetical protein